MSTRRHNWLDRDTAEQLLRGRPTGPPDASGALADMLMAAAAPARDHELAGEEEALAAFRNARLTPATQPRRREMIARALTLKIAVAAAVASAGSFALAAGTGHLPAQLGGASTSHTSSAATADPSPTGHASPGHSASPSPSLFGLCHAYANVAANPGKALDNPAFTALISAAGGKDKVNAFCAVVLKAGPSHAPSSHPTGKPSSHPTGKPSSHPTGKPSSHPTGKPSSLPTPTQHPTGAPTS
jgi:hypothetical protein